MEKNKMKKETQQMQESIKCKENNKKIFLWIVDYFLYYDRMPTLAEIGRQFNFTRERARQKMEKMVKYGWIIKKGKGKSGAYFPSLKAIDKLKYGKSN